MGNYYDGTEKIGPIMSAYPAVGAVLKNNKSKAPTIFRLLLSTAEQVPSILAPSLKKGKLQRLEVKGPCSLEGLSFPSNLHSDTHTSTTDLVGPADDVRLP